MNILNKIFQSFAPIAKKQSPDINQMQDFEAYLDFSNKKPWIKLEDAEISKISIELNNELNPKHKLYGLNFRAICKRIDCDDYGFEILDEPRRFVIVHLSWKHPDMDQWPESEIFNNYDSFKNKIEDDIKLEGDLSS